MSQETVSEKNIEQDLKNEEIRLLLERTEVIVRTFKENEEKFHQIASNDPFFLDQLRFIKDAIQELNSIIRNDNKIQAIVKVNNNLTHEIGNYMDYLRIPAKILNLRQQFKHDKAEELLANWKRKTSDFFNYCSDISKDYKAF